MAAATVGGPSLSAPGAGGRVGALGLGLEGVEEGPAGPALSSTTVATVAAPVTVPVAVHPPVTARRVPPTTTSPPGVGPGPIGSTPPPAALPPSSTTTTPTIAPISSWSAERDGIAVQVRMEPSAPVAGEPVRFLVEIASERSCCITHVDFGDGSEPYGGGGNCSNPSAGRTTVATHTYAAPGAYQARLIILSFPCAPLPTLPGGQPAPPMIYGPGAINTCVVIGPAPATKAGC
jgi:hypothetical protein